MFSSNGLWIPSALKIKKLLLQLSKWSIYAFIRRYYPQRYTVHIIYISYGHVWYPQLEPTTFVMLTQYLPIEIIALHLYAHLTVKLSYTRKITTPKHVMKEPHTWTRNKKWSCYLFTRDATCCKDSDGERALDENSPSNYACAPVGHSLLTSMITQPRNPAPNSKLLAGWRFKTGPSHARPEEATERCECAWCRE